MQEFSIQLRYPPSKQSLQCEKNVVFRDGVNFCKAFAGAQVNLSYHEWQSMVALLLFSAVGRSENQGVPVVIRWA